MWRLPATPGSGSRAASRLVSVLSAGRLHQLLGGRVRVRGMILGLFNGGISARKLLHLPWNGAREILGCSADFSQAARQYSTSERRKRGFGARNMRMAAKEIRRRERGFKRGEVSAISRSARVLVFSPHEPDFSGHSRRGRIPVGPTKRTTGSAISRGRQV